MEHRENELNRRWLTLVLLGILLHFIAFFTADLGLDAHVRLNALNDASSPGQELEWGPLRLDNSSEQSPSIPGDYDGYVAPWFSTPVSIKLTAMACMALLGALVAFQPKWSREEGMFEPMWAALLLLSPVLLFSVSRGYDEGALALLLGLGVSGFYFNQGETPSQQQGHVLLMSFSVLLLLGWKGFSLLTAATVWFGVLMAGFLWIALNHRLTKHHDDPVTQHPWKMAACSSMTVLLLVVMYGGISSSGTFSIVSQQPLLFLIALPFALFDTLVLYILIGFALWPFVWNRMEGLRSMRGPGISLLCGFSFGLLTGIVTYVAALWSLESVLWGQTLAQTMVVLGNNGRYATVLLVPIFLILRWPGSEQKDAVSFRTSGVALALILPLMLFTALIGHQLWSADAGLALSEAWEMEDQSFLMVADESLAMHHLYVIKSSIDVDGARDVKGYWRTVDVAPEFLASNQLDFLLIAPNVEYQPNPSSWTVVVQEPVPVAVPGGIQSGSWSLYRYTA